MDIKRDFYIKYYKVLHEKFLEKEHPAHTVAKYKGTLSPEVWIGHDNLTDQPKVTSYFAGRSGKCGIKYFYYKYLDFTSQKKKPWPESCEIDDLILIKTLIYIGVGEGLKLKVVDYNDNEKEITLNFNSLRNSREWINVDTEETRDILVGLFRNEYMSAHVISDSPIKSLPKQSDRTLIDILENNERELLHYPLNIESKNVLYAYIFNFAKPLSKRLFILEALKASPILTATEIITLFHIPDPQIRREAISHMDKLGAHLNDVDRYHIIKESTEVVLYDLELLYAFCNGAMHLHFLYGLTYLHNIITGNFAKPDKIGYPILREINQAFYTLSDIVFTDSCFKLLFCPIDTLFDELSPIEMLHQILSECYLVGGTIDQLNDFKFILIRNHQELYQEMKTFISTLLGENEKEYDETKEIYVPGVQINKMFQLPVDTYYPFQT